MANRRVKGKTVWYQFSQSNNRGVPILESLYLIDDEAKATFKKYNFFEVSNRGRFNSFRRSDKYDEPIEKEPVFHRLMKHLKENLPSDHPFISCMKDQWHKENGKLCKAERRSLNFKKDKDE